MNEQFLVIDACTPRIASNQFLDNIKAGGINACCVSLVGQTGGFFEAMSEMNLYYNLANSYPDSTVVAKTAEDILDAKKNNKLALVFSFQNAVPVEDDWVNRLPFFYRNGLRMVQLTYNETNRLGHGCFEPIDTGLTAIGIQIVREMNNLGIVIDLSHVGYKTTMDAIERSNDPCVFSHTACYALTPSMRNKTDEQMKAIAEKGGVVGISPYAPFVEPEANIGPTLDDYLKHVNYAVELVGIDHVGIGSDIAEHWAVRWAGGTPKRYPEMTKNYSWETIYAKGFHSVTCFPNVLDSLRKYGYKKTDISKIAGENLLRVFKQVWGK